MLLSENLFVLELPGVPKMNYYVPLRKYIGPRAFSRLKRETPAANGSLMWSDTPQRWRFGCFSGAMINPQTLRFSWIAIDPEQGDFLLGSFGIFHLSLTSIF